MKAHRREAIESRVSVFVIRYLQGVGCYCHLEWIGDLHDLRGQVIGSSNACRVCSLFCILRTAQEHFQTDIMIDNRFDDFLTRDLMTLQRGTHRKRQQQQQQQRRKNFLFRSTFVGFIRDTTIFNLDDEKLQRSLF
jgi:hypothetical protein